VGSEMCIRDSCATLDCGNGVVRRKQKDPSLVLFVRPVYAGHDGCKNGERRNVIEISLLISSF